VTRKDLEREHSRGEGGTSPWPLSWPCPPPAPALPTPPRCCCLRMCGCAVVLKRSATFEFRSLPSSLTHNTPSLSISHDACSRELAHARLSSLSLALPLSDPSPPQPREAAFDQIQAAGMTPSVVTYDFLISAYDKGARWQKAEEGNEGGWGDAERPYDLPTHAPSITGGVSSYSTRPSLGSPPTAGS
jgi:hypothetical protein